MVKTLYSILHRSLDLTVDWYDHFKLEKFYCEDCGFKIFQYRNTDKGKIVSAFYKF